MRLIRTIDEQQPHLYVNLTVAPEGTATSGTMYIYNRTDRLLLLTVQWPAEAVPLDVERGGGVLTVQRFKYAA